MQLDDLARDRESETRPPLLARAGVVDLLEFLENLGLIGRRDPGSGVDDRDLEIVVGACGPDLDLAFVRPKAKPEKPLAFVDLTQNTAARVLDKIVVINRLGKVANRTASASFEYIEALVSKPRTFYFPSNAVTMSGTGAPAFTLDGKVIGVLNEPGLYFLPSKLGVPAFIVHIFGKCYDLDMRLDQEYLRSQPVNSEEGAPMGIGFLVWPFKYLRIGLLSGSPALTIAPSSPPFITPA